MTVVGVDACKGGWVAVVLAEDEPPAALLLGSLGELEWKVPEAKGVGVDIPIGLPVDRRRPADVAARAFRSAPDVDLRSRGSRDQTGLPTVVGHTDLAPGHGQLGAGSSIGKSAKFGPVRVQCSGEAAS